jgi:predicted nuclease of predicted toxin-antitoxin system
VPAYTKYKWRIYADNDIERGIVDHLRQSGMDVLWISEDANLRRQQDDGFHYRKAKELGRYLLTRDQDFWDDSRHPLAASPGALIVSSADLDIARYLPVLLRAVMQGVDPSAKLDGIKVKMGTEGLTFKFVDRGTQRVTTESFNWRDIL